MNKEGKLNGNWVRKVTGKMASNYDLCARGHRYETILASTSAQSWSESIIT